MVWGCANLGKFDLLAILVAHPNKCFIETAFWICLLVLNDHPLIDLLTLGNAAALKT